ncbi:MAG: DUF5615 family PIN-like protein [Cyanobacteria bacterium P01_F01_bin.153]
MVKQLRQQGYDVQTSYEAGNANQNIPDPDVLAYATAQDRCVVTYNRQDFIKLHQTGVDHSGIVICKDDRDHRVQAEILDRYLQTCSTLRNKLLRILRQNQPGSDRQPFQVIEYSR